MVRTESVTLSPYASAASYREVAAHLWGFMVARKPGGAVQFPVLARVRYANALEWVDLVLWEGQVIRPARRIDRLTLCLPAGATAGDVWVTWADHRFDRIGEPAPEARGRVLYDSGVVATGAVIQSPVLDLSAVRELQVIVDNLAGTAFRDLALLSYLDDGATQVDSVMLRKCAMGNAANGAQQAPGRVRGLIGAAASPSAPGAWVLYDVTSAANGALDTGSLVTEEFDEVWVDAVCSGGTTQLTAFEARDDGAFRQVTNPPAASNVQQASWGRGSATATGAAGVSVVPYPVPRRVRFTASAAGVGNTVRLRVVARGGCPGAFAVPLALPPRGALWLGPGGANNCRLTIIGR